jgi:aminomuconate-semialdehyde/2-hydroxymuconate-6-semialdehyde dehydrogenase
MSGSHEAAPASGEVFFNYIDGEFRAPASGDYLDVHEPATGRVYARVAHSDEADVAAAVAAARRAFPAWSATRVSERARILNRIADLIDEEQESLARAESRDCGKPISMCRVLDVPRSASNLRYFAGAVVHDSGTWHETDQPAVGGPVHAMNYTVRRPRGVAGLISPWNLPLYLLTWKIAPAVATGNTCVCKPSEVTPATATLLGSIMSRAGVPAGVVNIVHGTGPHAGAGLVTHEDVPTVSFTGSTAVGRWIAAEAGRRLKRVSLELGGKNAVVVFGDADVADDSTDPDTVMNTLARAAFANQGQICLCGSRILVHRSVYARVRDGLVARARALVAGDPAEASTRFGSLTSSAHLEKVEDRVAQARMLGARVLCGGNRPGRETLPERCRDGYYFEATVMEGLDPACTVEQEEIFGPVVSLTAFDTEDEAAALANATGYGLAASIFTRDVSRAHRFADRVEAGVVWVNCWLVRDLRTPFGGMKQSGVGREGGVEALRFFTEAKNVCVRL